MMSVWDTFVEVSRDGAWQAVGVAVAIALGITTLLATYKTRSRRIFGYQQQSRTLLVGVHSKVKQKVEIYFEGKAVTNVHIFLVRLSNYGNTPLRPEDFHEPVTLDFGKDAVVLDAEVNEARPGFAPRLESSGRYVTLAPTLMNQGDYLTVRALVSGSSREISVGGRIAGVPELRPHEPGGFGLAIAGIGGIVAIAGVLADTAGASWGAILGAIGYTAFIAGATSNPRVRKSLRRVFRSAAK